MGGVVPVINIEGVKPGELTLDGPTLARMFLGQIKNWNDPAIAKLNPGLKLPTQAVVVVHRSDGSGTTFLFTDYLSKIHADWKSKVGANTAVEWPAGLGAKGNEGVANNVAQTKGAIGYVEYTYAKQTKLNYTKMVNLDGKAVAPTPESYTSAAAPADWDGTPGFGVILTNQPGSGSWPIAGASFILMHKKPPKPADSAEALKFFAWAYAKGGKMAEDLDFVPVPAKVIGAVQKSWSEIKNDKGQPVFAVSN
jgi:phosphate transport system substrate-binding protein